MARIESNANIRPLPYRTPLQTSVVAITEYITEDELALRLWEGPLNLIGEWRRYQVIDVIRNDKVAKHYSDLGPVGEKEPPAFNLIGGIIHPDGRLEPIEEVAFLKATAESMRGGDFAPDPNNPHVQRRDLKKMYWDWVEESQHRRHNTSTFGPGGHVQR